MAKLFQDKNEIFSFYHYLRSAGAHFPSEESKPQKRVSTNPDAVDSQQEADDIALAIQRSLAEEQKAKEVSKPVVSFRYFRLFIIYANYNIGLKIRSNLQSKLEIRHS